MEASYPLYREELAFHAEAAEFERVMDAIRTIRSTRTDMNVPPSRKATVYLATPYEDTFRAAAPFFERLASADGVQVAADWDAAGMVQMATDSARIFLPLESLIDKAKERERLDRELANCEKEIALHSGKLKNENFVSRAPERVVEEIRQKLQKAEELKEKLVASRQALGE